MRGDDWSKGKEGRLATWASQPGQLSLPSLSPPLARSRFVSTRRFYQATAIHTCPYTATRLLPMQSSLRSSLRRVAPSLTRRTLSLALPPCPACTPSTRSRPLSTSRLSPAPTLDRTPITTPTRGAPPPPVPAASAANPPKVAKKPSRVVKARKAAISLVCSHLSTVLQLPS